jgi:hypothetical protein
MGPLFYLATMHSYANMTILPADTQKQRGNNARPRNGLSRIIIITTRIILTTGTLLVKNDPVFRLFIDDSYPDFLIVIYTLCVTGTV